MSEHINEKYNDLENYFPVKIDEFERFIDPSIASLQAIRQYYQLYDVGKIPEANNILKSNPQLKRSIVNADNMNKIRDAIVSIERFYLEDVQRYLIDIIKSKGDWKSTNKYTKYDVVQFVHNEAIQSYMGIVIDIPVGTSPTNTAYFIPLTLQGKQGASGIGLSYRGLWNVMKEYLQDDCVSFEGILWYAKRNNLGIQPKDISDDWEAVLRLPHQIAISVTEPVGQHTDDIWYQILPDSIYKVNKKNADGTYMQINPVTYSEAIICDKSKGTTLKKTLEAKADLVNGKVPESQLPMTGGSVAQSTPPANTKLMWIDTANNNILKFHNGTAWIKASAVGIWG